ncbi:MAG TPA: hypothetical protein VK534_01110, partial [Methylomirabilota bacterium]|nr:hypothetical protein [Methylomirabilota bacterium]
MQHFMAVWGWWLRCFSYLVAGALLAICFVGVVMVNAQVNNQDIGNWSSPAAMTIRRVSPVSSSQSEPNFFNNLDCSLVTYRTPASSEMRTGCFTETAFGMMDSDSGIVIFNGTDEGVPLLAYSPGQVLAPWPHAGGLLQLEAVPTGGSRINLYKNPSATLQDQRNGLLQLTAKQLAVPADLLLKNAAGQPLVINSQTLAFSDSGSWLVAETLGGSFVRINLATLDVKAFAPSFGSQGSPGALLKSRVAISDDGRFAAIANQAAGTFKVYDLMSCASDVCPSYDYRSFAASQINGLQSI